MLSYVSDFGDEARVPLIAKQIIAQGSTVMNYRLSSPTDYWNEVHSAISKIEKNQLWLFDGCTEEEIKACLEKSNIIQCRAGDRVLNQGIKANNPFVVLSGTLELSDHDRAVAIIGPGDIFGETSFLLEQPRAKDVYAVTDVRVLSLSETVLKKIIESGSPIATKLLLNIAKLLCSRILTMR
jgi:CRP-like cAMP-binding protein